MLRRLLPLFGLVLPALAACSVATAVCHLQSAANLPAHLDAGRLLVTGQVNGAATSLLVDTGAETTVITRETVDALQLPRSARNQTRLRGVGGSVSNADVFADLDLGSVSANRRFPVAAVPNLGGLIGADILGQYDLAIDLPAGQVQLWRAAGCGLADLPWTGPRDTIPIQVTDGGGIHLAVAVDGHSVAALLDSGDGQTLLKTDAAQRLGVTQAALAGDRTIIGHGVDGGTISLRLHRFASLQVGQQRFQNATIGVGDLELAGTDMLLGVDYLRRHRVWISYRTGQMAVQAVAPGG